VSIAVGREKADITLPYEDNKGQASNLTLCEVLQHTLTDAILRGNSGTAFVDPNLLNFSITAADRQHVRNSNALRGAVRDIIAETKAKGIEEGTNLISVLLTDQYYLQDEERIIDEVLTLFAAGSQTVQMTTANLFVYISKDHRIRDLLNKEVDATLGPISDDFSGKFNNEVAQDLEYLGYCFLESLRIEPPVAISPF